jgi:Ni,Fe-hydrogenase III large subunit
VNDGCLWMRNCDAVPFDAVPVADTGGFCALMQQHLGAGGRIAAYFGFQWHDRLRLVAVIGMHANGSLAVFSCRAEKEMPSLAAYFPQLQLFEREIAEQFGLMFTGHPWMKPVRFQATLNGAAPVMSVAVGTTDFFSVTGDEIHEVAVGPVHAGVIEPGHFRFQCHGETVFHLEISLGYQHRDIERQLTGGPRTQTRYMIETAAGDSTAAHTIAYCQMMESAAGCVPSPRSLSLRGVALELERCANHIGDLGALGGDVGYLPTASYCGRIRGDALNATAMLCGSRFGRSFVCEGGVLFECDDTLLARVATGAISIRKDFASAADLLFNEPSVLARFEDTGTVSRESCLDLGVVGPAARASGCIQDVRQDFPAGVYRFSHIPVVTHPNGDVFSRAFVRYGEVMHSLEFVREQCANMPPGIARAACGKPEKNSFMVSLVEGWRGEVCHVAVTDENGAFARYKIVDPSFHNWSALAFAMRDQQISDFPLCNKSFNLSYCGHDL